MAMASVPVADGFLSMWRELRLPMMRWDGIRMFIHDCGKSVLKVLCVAFKVSFIENWGYSEQMESIGELVVVAGRKGDKLHICRNFTTKGLLRLTLSRLELDENVFDNDYVKDVWLVCVGVGKRVGLLYPMTRMSGMVEAYCTERYRLPLLFQTFKTPDCDAEYMVVYITFDRVQNLYFWEDVPGFQFLHH